MFSLLHPSRNRPAKTLATMQKWERLANVEHEIIVSIDSDEVMIGEYQSLPPNWRLIVNPNRSAVDAINRAAEVAKFNVFIVVSDDTDCPEDWGGIIGQAIEGRRDFVLRVEDGIQDWICTMPVLDRVYYNRFGYVYHPGYLHQFCDCEFTHVACLTQRIIRRNDILFRHLHPPSLKQKRDETLLRSDSTWDQGKELYISRFKEGFGLGIDDYTDHQKYRVGHNHQRWLKQNAR